MSKNIDLSALEAARQMAALSPETQGGLEACMALGWSGLEEPTQAFHAIGAAIASKRRPIAEANKKKLFDFAEQLLKHGSREVSNAIATCMLEQIWTATRESGFDFASVDPYLGPEARGYLVAWDDFNKTRTEGLTRK